MTGVVAPPGPGADKGEWRAWARSVAAGIDMAAVSAAIRAVLASWDGLGRERRVLLYDPLPGEPDLTALAGEVTALLTRTPGEGPLTIHPFGSPRERHRFGFAQPVAGAAVVEPGEVDVVLVPGLAFDRSGVRLGRGGGFYDRLLPGLRPDALVVGVAPAALVVDRLPREPHDRVMTHLLTERGIGRVPPMPMETARAWIAADPDPVTRAELQALVDSGDETEVAARLVPLEFGTAGIRGEVGAGPGRMNRAVVIRTTRGLADHLASAGRGGTIVVGYDGRTDSRRFAEDAVGVLRAAGFAVVCFDGPTPTPVVAHQALVRGAVAAVVVTASHNPPADNGYKVYGGNGAQIVPPTDTAISAAVAAVGPANTVPRTDGFGGEDPDVAEAAHRDAVLAFRGPAPAAGTVPIVVTPLHGVGGRAAVRLLAAGGHDRVEVVEEQFAPDGRFPTVAFPNPEEPGALDRAEGLATARGAALVLANDPDADRLGVVVPVAGGWQRLTGNEIGVLLGDFVLERTAGPDRLVVTTVVSTPMLATVAAAHGAEHAVTLTGFKWICNAALDLEDRGRRFVFGFEEALGYAVGPVVRDKDGLSAALWFADLAAVCAAAGETVLDRLARLQVRHGVWVSRPRTVTASGPDGVAGITAAVERLAAAPPRSLAGIAVAAVTDWSLGAEARPRWLPATRLVTLDLADGSRVQARPSGTEPKLKIYVDVRGEAGTVTAVAAARGEAAARGDALGAALAAEMGW